MTQVSEPNTNGSPRPFLHGTPVYDSYSTLQFQQLAHLESPGPLLPLLQCKSKMLPAHLPRACMAPPLLKTYPPNSCLQHSERLRQWNRSRLKSPSLSLNSNGPVIVPDVESLLFFPLVAWLELFRPISVMLLVAKRCRWEKTGGAYPGRPTD